MFRGPIAVMNMVQAGWIGMVFPRLFGKRVKFKCDVTGKVVTVSVWRGKEYFLDSRK